MQQIETDMAKLKQTVQFNPDRVIDRMFNRITKYLQDQNENAFEDGDLSIPEYHISNPIVIGASMERFKSDLENNLITADQIERYKQMYDSQEYGSGLHSHMTEETAHTIYHAVAHIQRINPEVGKSLFWKSKPNFKAIINLALYYTVDYIRTKEEAK